MAKRQKNRHVTVAFNYLAKVVENPQDPKNPIEIGFSEAEFQKVINRLTNITPLDDSNEEVVAAIKSGQTLPFLAYDEIEEGLHFGDFEGAYYGQRFRNNRVGDISADDLNLRRFHYLITRLRDGKIMIGVSYHGQFGAYSDLRSVLSSLLRGDYKIASKTLRSLRAEIGDGTPVELRLAYRRAPGRVEHRSVFDSSGAIAVRRADYGDGFEGEVRDIAGRLHGDNQQRKSTIAEIVNQSQMLDINEDDIIGCSAIVTRNGRRNTVYFLGENNYSTKFPINVDVNAEGMANRGQVSREMVRVLRDEILPMFT